MKQTLRCILCDITVDISESNKFYCYDDMQCMETPDGKGYHGVCVKCADYHAELAKTQKELRSL